MALSAFQAKFNQNKDSVAPTDYQHQKLMRRISTLTEINHISGANDEKEKPLLKNQKFFHSERRLSKLLEKDSRESRGVGEKEKEQSKSQKFFESERKLSKILEKNPNEIKPKQQGRKFHKTVINENKQARKEIEEDILGFLVKETSKDRINTYLNYKMATGKFELNTKKIDEMVKNKLKSLKEEEALMKINKRVSLGQSPKDLRIRSQDRLVSLLNSKMKIDPSSGQERPQTNIRRRPANRTAVRVISSLDLGHIGQARHSNHSKAKFALNER
jgi:hypothetical protein